MILHDFMQKRDLHIIEKLKTVSLYNYLIRVGTSPESCIYLKVHNSN